MELKAFVKGTWEKSIELDLSHLDIVETMAESFKRLCATEPAQLSESFLRACKDMGLLEMVGAGEKPGPMYAGVLTAIARSAPDVARYIASHHSAMLLSGSNPPSEMTVAADSWVTRHQDTLEFALDLPLELVDGVLFVDAHDPSQLSLYRAASGGLRLLKGCDHWSKSASYSCAPQQVRSDNLGEWQAKLVLDQMALCLGQLQRGHQLSLNFTENRILFKRKLNEFQLTQTRHVQMAASLTALEAVLEMTALRIQAGDTMHDLTLLQSVFVRRAKRLGSDLLQIFAGTGYMTESGMPACYTWLLHFVEYYPSAWRRDPDWQEYIGPDSNSNPEPCLPEWPNLPINARQLWQAYHQAAARPKAHLGLASASSQHDLVFGCYALACMGILSQARHEVESSSARKWHNLCAYLTKTQVLGTWLEVSP